MLKVHINDNHEPTFLEMAGSPNDLTVSFSRAIAEVVMAMVRGVPMIPQEKIMEMAEAAAMVGMSYARMKLREEKDGEQYGLEKEEMIIEAEAQEIYYLFPCDYYHAAAQEIYDFMVERRRRGL